MDQCSGVWPWIATSQALLAMTKGGKCDCPGGMIFASTKPPLRTWFRATRHLTQTEQGVSSIELGRRLSVAQTTAQRVRHKLKQVMMGRGQAASRWRCRSSWL